MAPTAKLLKGPPPPLFGMRRRTYSFLSSLRYASICGGSALRSRFDAHSAAPFRFALEMTQALWTKSLEPERQTVSRRVALPGRGRPWCVTSLGAALITGRNPKSTILARSCFREIGNIFIAVAHKRTFVSCVKLVDENISTIDGKWIWHDISSLFVRDCVYARTTSKREIYSRRKWIRLLETWIYMFTQWIELVILCLW